MQRSVWNRNYFYDNTIRQQLHDLFVILFYRRYWLFMKRIQTFVDRLLWPVKGKHFEVRILKIRCNKFPHNWISLEILFKHNNGLFWYQWMICFYYFILQFRFVLHFLWRKSNSVNHQRLIYLYKGSIKFIILETFMSGKFAICEMKLM